MRHAAVLALLCLVVCAPLPGAQQAKPERHVEKEGGFSFVPPSEWTIREIPGFKYKLAAGPAAKGFAPNIIFVDEAFKGDLKEYVAANKQNLRRFAKGLKEISEMELKTTDGVTCIRLIIENSHDGKTLRQTFFFFDLASDRKLVVTCSALADGGDKLDPLFEASVKTLRLEKK